MSAAAPPPGPRWGAPLTGPDPVANPKVDPTGHLDPEAGAARDVDPATGSAADSATDPAAPGPALQAGLEEAGRGDAVPAVLDDPALVGDLAAEGDAAARRALRRHLDALARSAVETALAGEGGQQVRHDVEAATADVLAGAPAPEAAPVGGGGAAREPLYDNVADWLQGYLLRNYRRRQLHTRWCQHWWEHGEAINRLEAIWQAWEALRYDGATGMAVWWRDYADPHLRVLTDPEGPFFDCDASTDKHRVPEPFTVQAPPPGMFRRGDHPEEQDG